MFIITLKGHPQGIYSVFDALEAETYFIINSCRAQGQKFSIISPDDLIIPPDEITKG